MRIATRLMSLVFVVLLSGALYAQSAKVIALSSEDAHSVRDLYAERDLLDKRMAEMQKHIEDKYLSDTKPGRGSNNMIIVGPSVTSGCPAIFSSNGIGANCPSETATEKKAREEREAREKAEDAKKTHLERKPGWGSFIFSEDFRFIVPNQTPVPNSTCCSGSYLGGYCNGNSWIIPASRIYN